MTLAPPLALGVYSETQTLSRDSQEAVFRDRTTRPTRGHLDDPPAPSRLEHLLNKHRAGAASSISRLILCPEWAVSTALVGGCATHTCLEIRVKGVLRSNDQATLLSRAQQVARAELRTHTAELRNAWHPRRALRPGGSPGYFHNPFWFMVIYS